MKGLAIDRTGSLLGTEIIVQDGEGRTAGLTVSGDIKIGDANVVEAFIDVPKEVLEIKVNKPLDSQDEDDIIMDVYNNTIPLLQEAKKKLAEDFNVVSVNFAGPQLGKDRQTIIVPFMYQAAYAN